MENESIMQKLHSASTVIQSFLLSMQRLQRAVAQKDSENLDRYKAKFEKNRKELERIPKSMKESSSHSNLPRQKAGKIVSKTSQRPKEYAIKHILSASKYMEVKY
jgi:hypothetical protein